MNKLLLVLFSGGHSSWIDRVTEGIWSIVETVSPFLGFGSFGHATWADAALQQGYGHRRQRWTINCRQKEGLKQRYGISCRHFVLPSNCVPIICFFSEDLSLKIEISLLFYPFVGTDWIEDNKASRNKIEQAVESRAVCWVVESVLEEKRPVGFH